MAQSDPKIVGEAMYETMTSDLRPALPAIRVPVTILYPWDEAALGEARANAFYPAAYHDLAGARLVPIAHSQHFIMLDQPAAFEAALKDFLAGGEPSGA